MCSKFSHASHSTRGSVICLLLGIVSTTLLFSSGYAERSAPTMVEPEETAFGPQTCKRTVGDPIDAVTGNMYYEVTDVTIESDFNTQLEFKRSYNAGGGLSGPQSSLGPKWTHTFSAVLRIDSLGWVTLIESTGRHVPFRGFRSPSDLSYRLEYDQQTGQYSITNSDNTVLKFGTDGRLIAICERDYPRVQLTYEDGRLAKASDMSGRYLRFTYNYVGRIQEITLSDGSSYAMFDYDEDNFTPLIKVTYADGTWEQYEYDDAGGYPVLMTSRCNSDGVCWFYEYDRWTRVTANYGNDSVQLMTLIFWKKQEPDGPLTYCTTVHDEDITEFEAVKYPSTGRRKLIRRECLTSPGKSLRLIYDEGGNKIRSEYEDGPIDSLAYDSLGRTIAWWSSRAGEILTQVARGTFLPSRFNLDDFIALARFDPGGGLLIDFEYDSQGNVTNVVERSLMLVGAGFDRISEYEYNALGQVVSADGPDLGDTDAMWLEYYDNGDMKSCTDARGTVVEFGKRDALGNPTWMRSSDGSEILFEHDCRGRQVCVQFTDSNGNTETTRFEYNFASDVIQCSLPDGNQVEYIYDNHGWLVAVDHSEFGREAYTYDTYGNRLSEIAISPDGDTLRNIQLQR